MGQEIKTKYSICVYLRFLFNNLMNNLRIHMHVNVFLLREHHTYPMESVQDMTVF